MNIMNSAVDTTVMASMIMMRVMMIIIKVMSEMIMIKIAVMPDILIMNMMFSM